eukprot:362652-Chlamydomonas_euryale.AAC.1
MKSSKTWPTRGPAAPSIATYKRYAGRKHSRYATAATAGAATQIASSGRLRSSSGFCTTAFRNVTTNSSSHATNANANQNCIGRR